MWPRSIWLLALAATRGLADDSSESSGVSQFTTLTGTTLSISLSGSYQSYSSQISATKTSGLVSASGSTDTSITTTTSAGSTSTITLLVGGVGAEVLTVINETVTLSSNFTVSATKSSTSSSTVPTNTQPCNGWAEFCDRSYGNITQVAAHNAAFAVTGNAASNQKYGLTTQLNDGIRMLTGETHWVNNTIYSCHTSCDLLNVGTLQSNLEEVAEWVQDNPYNVVTLLLVNSDFRPVEDYVDSIQNSGLAPYLYEPPYIPMRLRDWPILSSFILSEKRVVIFMDYNANQTSVPYILDEFTHMWETPFSPQNASFPCTLQRPPSLTNVTEATDDFMYLANHNLNQAVSFAGESFLIPNTAVINNTNAAGYDFGMLGLMANTCQAEWIDYYNTEDGSAFDVAARLNGVTYDKKCCGVAQSGARIPGIGVSLLAVHLILVVSWVSL
ncbi:hypothetical protein ANO11243_004320 [Dothideomycetidae sp. 11243]|nr:hypothetical protein ANO11243_004320 [fungal sp. No.11243]